METQKFRLYGWNTIKIAAKLSSDNSDYFSVLPSRKNKRGIKKYVTSWQLFVLRLDKLSNLNLSL